MYRSPFTAPARQSCAFKKKGSWAAGYHTGEDWVCDNRELVSPANGIVSYVGSGGAYGNYIIIHTDDSNCILMAHMRDKPKVKKGRTIKAGQSVGIMGSTGNSTGAHLHIEVERGTDWNYNKNLLKPSDYIDFGNYTESEVFNMPKSYKNGSTIEYVYQNTKQCNAQNSLYSIGYLNKNEKCDCYATIDGCYLVVYNASGTKKTGFVKYNGGIK